jgi:hypothetical protein
LVAGIIVGGTFVGLGVLVGADAVGLALGRAVFGGGSVTYGSRGVGVGVGERLTTGVEVFLGSFVAVLSPGSGTTDVEVPGKVPDQGNVGVGVGISGVTKAI